MATGPHVVMCRACRSAQVEEIDALLRDGRLSRREIGRRVGLGRGSIDGHVGRGHVAPAPLSLPVAPVASTGDPLADLTAQRDALNAIDAATLSPAMQMALYSERRRTAESMAKLAPRDVPESASVRELRVMEEMAVVIDGVLERHHAVRAEVAAALAEWKQNREAS